MYSGTVSQSVSRAKFWQDWDVSLLWKGIFVCVWYHTVSLQNKQQVGLSAAPNKRLRFPKTVHVWCLLWEDLSGISTLTPVRVGERRCHWWTETRLVSKRPASQVLFVSHFVLKNHKEGWASQALVSDMSSVLFCQLYGECNRLTCLWVRLLILTNLFRLRRARR